MVYQHSISSQMFFCSLRLRFPAQDSIIKILQRRYGDGLVKKVRKFEKFYFKYRKALLDLEFLQSCKKEKLIPKFLQFKVANKRLESSEAYLSCQRRLLNQEIHKMLWFEYRILISHVLMSTTCMDDPRHKNCLWMVSDGGKINLLSMKYLYRTMIKEVYAWTWC